MLIRTLYIEPWNRLRSYDMVSKSKTWIVFYKPSALSFDGNTSENWRRFKQQFDIYITASGSEKKGDEVKIAILLNFAGEDAIEVFNTFQFAEGDAKKLDKVLEQFERYCNPRKNVVFERHQFWQITQKDSETVDQFVTRLKNKVKLASTRRRLMTCCETSSCLVYEIYK